ncbi:hypothetical protein QYE76_062901 [Lolium multiflorum]|uniref:Transposase (putative) gypsy type domain-containing protein n=1 Tax=Lolium multiflorum TaxID=4521 RepID=A0AAD8S3J4_LOLMU|nr:hypothetical protein QYE76_062901 [Lolium multiflorum]
MAVKVQESELKKASKARNREGEKGQWWPCDVTESELKAFEKEGLLASESWKFTKDSITPTPDPDERVFTKAWVERGLSLLPSEFFLSLLSTYGLQPHNICPNSYLLLSNFANLCEELENLATSALSNAVKSLITSGNEGIRVQQRHRSVRSKQTDLRKIFILACEKPNDRHHKQSNISSPHAGNPSCRITKEEDRDVDHAYRRRTVTGGGGRHCSIESSMATDGEPQAPAK